MPTPDQSAARRDKIHRIADEVDAVANASVDDAAYPKFEKLLDEFHAQGFFADAQLVSAAAFARRRDNQS
jgi:hypothetical protein